MPKRSSPSAPSYTRFSSPCSPTLSEFLSSYNKTALAFFEGATQPDGAMPEPLKVMRQIWVSAKSVDGPSWTVETGGEFSSDDNNRNDRLEFLREDGPEGYCSEFLRDDGPEGYCSFILQKSVDAIKETTQKVPVTTLPLASAAESGPSDGDTMETSSPIWVFVGRNKKNASIQGRPEHTDSISHSGTFHYQISGSKI